MQQFKLPNYDTVLEIHQIVIEESGGLSGLLHSDYIKSAISRPQSYMDYDESCDLHLVAALVLDSIARYHAFADGNKRTALITMLMTYRLNKVQLEYTLMTNEELENLVLEVADNKKTLTIKQIRNRLKKIVDKFSAS